MTTLTLSEVLPNGSTVTISISGENTRLTNTSKKVKKFLNRTYGPKTGKALKKLDLSEGLNKMDLASFIKILENEDFKKKSLLAKTKKALKKLKISDLSEIPWEDMPSKNRRARALANRIFMKLNHKFLKDNAIAKEDLDMDALPVKGFKEREVIKFYDV